MSVYNRFLFFLFFLYYRLVYTILGYRYKRKNDINWRLTTNTIKIHSLAVFSLYSSLMATCSTIIFFIPSFSYSSFIHSLYICTIVRMHILSLLLVPLLRSLRKVFFHGRKFYNFERGFNPRTRLILVPNNCRDIVYYLANRYLDRNNACTSISVRTWKTLFCKRIFVYSPNTLIILLSLIVSEVFFIRFRSDLLIQRRRINDPFTVTSRSFISNIYSHTYHPLHLRFVFALAVAVSKDFFVCFFLYESIQRLNL